MYIVWNKNSELGIPIIDEQHRGIVTTINSFHYFIKSGNGIDALRPTLKILEQYTCIHFRTEEALIKKAAYPNFEEHKKLHEKLMKRTREITKESVSYKEPELALAFLKDWWLNHINKEDKLYSFYLKNYLGIQ